MYDTYIIETRKGAAGIVVRDGRGFRFFAATHDFNHLEGQVFGSPRTPKPRRSGGVKEAPNVSHKDELARQRSI
jgi:hypothetical protein